MYKKKLAMDTSNNHDESIDSTNESEDPLADADASQNEAAAQNGDANGKKAKKEGKKRKPKSRVIKVARKKTSKKAEKAPEPGPDENGEYEVEAIIDHKKEKGKTVYRIRWKGYGPSQDTWLPGTDLGCKELLKKYKKKLERENKNVYTVEKILDHRRLHGTTYYRIRWEGYTSKDDTWQAKETLNCNELLKKYHEDVNNEILKREEEKLKAQQNAKKTGGEYEVESIIDCKKYKDKIKYRVRWKGFEEADDTWEPEESLNCPELIKAFKKKSKAKAKPKKYKSAKKRKNYDDSGSEEDDSDDSDFGAPKRSKGGEYEVEKILNARINRNGKWEFFVMWKGYGPDENNWEPESNLNCPKLINKFLGKDKVPRVIQTKLEKLGDSKGEAPKPKRKPPTERKMYVPGSKGIRGRTKGAMKVLKS